MTRLSGSEVVVFWERTQTATPRPARARETRRPPSLGAGPPELRRVLRVLTLHAPPGRLLLVSRPRVQGPRGSGRPWVPEPATSSSASRCPCAPFSRPAPPAPLCPSARSRAPVHPGRPRGRLGQTPPLASPPVASGSVSVTANRSAVVITFLCSQNNFASFEGKNKRVLLKITNARAQLTGDYCSSAEAFHFLKTAQHVHSRESLRYGSARVLSLQVRT